MGGSGLTHLAREGDFAVTVDDRGGPEADLGLRYEVGDVHVQGATMQGNEEHGGLRRYGGGVLGHRDALLRVKTGFRECHGPPNEESNGSSSVTRGLRGGGLRQHQGRESSGPNRNGWMDHVTPHLEVLDENGEVAIGSKSEGGYRDFLPRILLQCEASLGGAVDAIKGRGAGDRHCQTQQQQHHTPESTLSLSVCPH